MVASYQSVYMVQNVVMAGNFNQFVSKGGHLWADTVGKA